ncbi:MAG: hypothetical protein U1E52_18010 [Geminicoccaceae bacterium]
MPLRAGRTWLRVLLGGLYPALIAVSVLFHPALADQTDARLGKLFARLREAADAADAAGIEAEIWGIWGETTGADARSLYARGMAAMAGGDAQTAAAAFDLLVQLQPRFAEAWNKRATLKYLMGDDEGSIADIGRTLMLEPRHFGALSGLALILERQGRFGEAVRSLKAALAVDPHLSGGSERLRTLEGKAAGDPT